MAITFDGSIEQIDAFNYKKKGGTVGTESATLGVCISTFDPGAEVHIRFRRKAQDGKIYYVNRKNTVTGTFTPRLDIIKLRTDPCDYSTSVQYDRNDTEIIYEIEVKFGNVDLSINSQINSHT